jgi:hypothetical protein
MLVQLSTACSSIRTKRQMPGAKADAKLGSSKLYPMLPKPVSAAVRECAVDCLHSTTQDTFNHMHFMPALGYRQNQCLHIHQSIDLVPCCGRITHLPRGSVNPGAYTTTARQAAEQRMLVLTYAVVLSKLAACHGGQRVQAVGGPVCLT